jgi:aminopeptidase N
MFLQHEKGNKVFLDKLRDYRKSVFSARHYLFFSGEESGPIIQGYRTASSKTIGDYNLIIYRKAALVLHMIRGMLTDPAGGDDSRFFDMMREFVARYAGQPATTADFQELVELYTGTDQAQFFRQWVYGNELPEVNVRTAITGGPDSGWTLTCRFERRKVTEPFVLDVPLKVIFEAGSPELQRVILAQPITELRLWFTRKPKKVQLNPFEFALISVN